MHAYGSFSRRGPDEAALPPFPFTPLHDRSAATLPPPRASPLRRLVTAGGLAVLLAATLLAAVYTSTSGAGGVGGFGSGSAPLNAAVGKASAAEPRLSATPPRVAVMTSAAIDATEEATAERGAVGADAGAAAATTLGFVACNEYTCENTPNFFLYPWLANTKLVEPHRDTFLSVVDAREGHQYYWTLTDRYGAVTTLSGETLTHQFTELERHTVTLQEVRPAALAEHGRNSITRSYTESVMCKYVRREIRSLTDSERNEMLDAMRTLWVVSSEEGRKLWGPDYTDITGLLKFHHLGASNYSCDAFHDGLGFPITHFLMTNLFEQTIQLINPKISLPYWDYTIEDWTIQRDYDGVYANLQIASPMFLPTWFGSADKADNMVKDGRWAWTKVLMVTDADRAGGMESNVYGQMRSPWSSNSNPFLVRGMGELCGDLIYPSHYWPSCTWHHDLLQYDTYYDWAYQSLGKNHGPIHFWIGGVNDCDQTFMEIAGLVGPTAAAAFRDYADENRKNMWRGGLWSCDGTVPLGTPLKQTMEETCGCEQAGWDLSDDDQVVTVLSKLIGYSEVEDQSIEVKRKVLDLLCHGTINMGEQLQSSSPQDPSFWSIHPTLERLLQVKLSSKTLDMTWIARGYSTKVDGVSKKYKVSAYGDSCIGHRPYDVWPYGLVSDSEFSTKLYMFGEKKENTLTNYEATLALSPDIDALPYVYDSFSWPHCEAQGIDMLDILNQEPMENFPTFDLDFEWQPNVGVGPSSPPK
ncbi:unnamed protein product [Phaeothamnion confervicola]